MSTNLKDFLHEQAEKYRVQAETNKVEITEWRAAVSNLNEQIKNWLKDSDTDNVVEFQESDKEMTEPGLGRYRVPRLNVRILDKWIAVLPKARRTALKARPTANSPEMQSQGRVDITDDLRRFVLFRFHVGDRDVWLIDSPEHGFDATEKVWPGEIRYVPRSERRELNRETFEKIVMSYLL